MSLVSLVKNFARGLVKLGGVVLLSGCSMFGNMGDKPVLSRDERSALEERVAQAQSQPQSQVFVEPSKDSESHGNPVDVPVARVIPRDPFFSEWGSFYDDVQKLMNQADETGMLLYPNDKDAAQVVFSAIKDENSRLGKACRRICDIVSLQSGQRFSIDDYGLSDVFSVFDMGVFGVGKRVFMLPKLQDMRSGGSYDDVVHLVGYELDPNVNSSKHRASFTHRLRSEVVAELFKWFLYDGIRKNHDVEFGIVNIDKKIRFLGGQSWNSDFDDKTDISGSGMDDDRREKSFLPNASRLIAGYFVSKYGAERAWQLVRRCDDAVFVSLLPSRDVKVLAKDVVPGLNKRFAEGYDDLASYAIESAKFDKLIPIFEDIRKGDYSRVVDKGDCAYIETDELRLSTGGKLFEFDCIDPTFLRLSKMSNPYLKKKIDDGLFQASKRVLKQAKVDWSAVSNHFAGLKKDAGRRVLEKLIEHDFVLGSRIFISAEALLPGVIEYLPANKNDNKFASIVYSIDNEKSEYGVDKKGAYIYSCGSRVYVPEFDELFEKVGLGAEFRESLDK